MPEEKMITDSIIGGILAGLLTVVVSEWLLFRSRISAVKNFWKLSLVSSAVRVVCVVVTLVFGLQVRHLDPTYFTFVLLVVYFAGLLFEARRYNRWIETR